MTTRSVIISLWMALLVSSCGGDKKKKKVKEPKPPSPMARLETVCQATCARDERCADDEDERDDLDDDSCLRTCRTERAHRMHVFRPKFVSAYGECLERLDCDKDVGRCLAVAVATVMEDPDERQKSKDEKAKSDDDKTKPPKKKKKDKKKKVSPKAAKKLKEEKLAAEAARHVFRRCHDRRVGCDGTWSERCNAAVAFNDGGRARVLDCLRMPCDRVRTCLRDAAAW